MKNKLKGKTTSGYKWTPTRWKRKLCMPQTQSTCPSGHAADAVARRCNLFHWMKRINRVPRSHMKGGVLEQLLGGGTTQHITND